MGKRSRPSSKDWIMAQWPENLSDPNADIITPYPCCSCKKEFRSTKGLRTHDCQPNRKSAHAA